MYQGFYLNMANQLADFDWDLVGTKGIGGGYSTEERARLEALIEGTLNLVTEKEVVKVL
jgi:small subunit ribosomal protein S1